jgi:hypothetical protein
MLESRIARKCEVFWSLKDHDKEMARLIQDHSQVQSKSTQGHHEACPRLYTTVITSYYEDGLSNNMYVVSIQ